MPTIDELLVILFNHPLTYIIITGLMIFLILKKINEGKLRPEQKPDFGVKLRASRVKKHMDKREKAFGEKPTTKSILYHGIRPIGRVMKIEEIPRMNPHRLMLWCFKYRRFGFVKRFMAMLGFGINRIIVDVDSIFSNFDSDKKQIEYTIDRNAFFRERGGVLFLSKDVEKKFIDEINADADYENAKGFVSDFPRRLSNLHPSHAINTDSLELEANLEEKKRKSYIERITGRG